MEKKKEAESSSRINFNKDCTACVMMEGMFFFPVLTA